jgi:hypothetical protein
VAPPINPSRDRTACVVGRLGGLRLVCVRRVEQIAPCIAVVLRPAPRGISHDGRRSQDRDFARRRTQDHRATGEIAPKLHNEVKEHGLTGVLHRDPAHGHRGEVSQRGAKAAHYKRTVPARMPQR